MFIVENKAYKIVGSEIISTELLNIDILKKTNYLTDNNNLKRIKRTNNALRKVINIEENTFTVKNAYYKTKLYIQTENFWNSFPTRTERETEFTVTNYKNGLFGYYVYTLPTTYEIYLESHDVDTDIYYILAESITNHDIKDYNRSEKILITNGWTNTYYPYFSTKYGTVITQAGEITF